MGDEHLVVLLYDFGFQVNGSGGVDHDPIRGYATAGTYTGYFYRGQAQGQLFGQDFALVLSPVCSHFEGSATLGDLKNGFHQVSWTGEHVAGGAVSEAVIDAYRSNLCRDPDTEGRVYWTASGASREQVDAALQATDEWQRWQPLRDVYLDTVAKDPASTEFDGRMCTQVQRYLAEGTPLDQVRSGLAATRAGQRVRAIRDMYLELLERDPLPAERQTVGQLAWSGLPLEAIRARIVASPEYEERHPNG